MHPIPIAAAILTATLVASAKTISHVEREANGESERIIGGQDASDGQFPWTVALFYNGVFACTASILSPSKILTAAHCVIIEGVLQSPSLFHGIANVNRSAPETWIEFESILPHPDYDEGAIDNDVALLKTTKAIDMTAVDGPKPVCIARPDTELMEYTNATAMGWGNTQRWSFLPRNMPEILQYAEQHIVHNDHCAFINQGINDEKICAKGFSWQGFTGICNGDSGGPLVHLSAHKPPVLIGIASYVHRVLRCGKVAPGVWTRASVHYEFIMHSFGEESSICEV